MSRIHLHGQNTKSYSPGHVPPADGLNQPVPRWLWSVLILLVTAAALLVALNWNVLHVYRKYFLQDWPEARMPWAQLSPEMDEAAAKALFKGLPLFCFDDRTSLGQRSCYAAVSKVDGYPALTVALFFRNGRLSVATVHVPWWDHDKAVEALSARLGPSRLARAGGSLDELRRWDVAGGIVDMNKDQGLNVLQWSAVVWIPRGASAPQPRAKEGAGTATGVRI
jgi:hypothetical protein